MSFYKPPSVLEVKAHISLNATAMSGPENWQGVGDIDVTLPLVSPQSMFFVGIGDGTYASFSCQQNNDMPCKTLCLP